MSELNQRVQVEFANIDCILAELPEIGALPRLSVLEIAGVAALLHNFYNGVESALKQIIRARGLEIPSGNSWHRDLVSLASSHGIISETTANRLRQYLAFRHFFSHGYAVDLDLERMQPLVEQVEEVYRRLRGDLERAVEGDC